MAASHGFNLVRRRFGFSYWSLSAYVKHRVKNAVEYVGRFERAVADEARRRRVDGVVCGHIHKAEMRTIDGVLYCNDGDWVESCTALVEHLDGRLEVLDWIRLRALDPMRAAAVTPDLLPTVATGADGGAGTDLFADDAIFPSRRALGLLGLEVGDTVELVVGTERVALRVAGLAERVPADLAVAVMDLGTLQWRLGWLGRGRVQWLPLYPLQAVSRPNAGCARAASAAASDRRISRGTRNMKAW